MGIVITLICFFLAGICKAVSDTLADHFYDSIFSKLDAGKWNKAVSSIRKYNQKVYFETGEKVRRFPGSLTWLVWFTDNWHKFNFLQMSIITIGVITFRYNFQHWYEYVIAFLVLKFTYSAGFVPFYTKFFKLKTYQK